MTVIFIAFIAAGPFFADIFIAFIAADPLFAADPFIASDALLQLKALPHNH